MTGHQIVTALVTASFDRIAEYTSRADGPAWSQRVLPGTNPVGFTLWHAARTVDWGVQCAIRGVDEVASRSEWRGRWPAEAWFGAGVSPSLAESLPQRVDAAVVAAYNEAVRAEVLGWLAGLDDGVLDERPPFREHNERAGYTAPEIWHEIADLEGLPTAMLLLRPCMNHVRVHAGEMELLLQQAGQLSE
jgi:hypothetical protein